MNPVSPTSITQSSVNTDSQKKKLKESCQEFESFMTSSMLKAMRESVSRAEEPNQALSLYEEMMDQAISKDFSRGKGLGLGQTLYKKLEPLVQENPQNAGTASGSQQKVENQ